MSSEKLVKLVIGLKKKTDNKEITWNQSSQTDAYEVELTNYTVRIYTKENFEGSLDVCISIYRQNGDFIETFNDNEIDKGEFIEKAVSAGMAPGPFHVMYSIFNSARRQALGVDEALDDIISDLDDDFLK